MARVAALICDEVTRAKLDSDAVGHYARADEKEYHFYIFWNPPAIAAA